MLTNTPEGRALINEVAFAIINERVPEEIPFYVRTRDNYFADPDTFLDPPGDDDKALSFGSGIPVEAFSLIVFPIVAPLLEILVQEVVKSIGKESGSKAVNRITSLFNGQNPEEKTIFTASELNRIKKAFDATAEKEAKRLNLKKSEVQAVGDAVITKLVLATE